MRWVVGYEFVVEGAPAAIAVIKVRRVGVERLVLVATAPHTGRCQLVCNHVRVIVEHLSGMSAS